nr:MAG TPA: hypothetical protein [Caudoviricetes sp.]
MFIEARHKATASTTGTSPCLHLNIIIAQNCEIFYPFCEFCFLFANLIWQTQTCPFKPPDNASLDH